LEKAIEDKHNTDVTKAELLSRLEKYLKKGSADQNFGWSVIKEKADRLSERVL
jgi:hypothetical protein